MQSFVYVIIIVLLPILLVGSKDSKKDKLGTDSLYFLASLLILIIFYGFVPKPGDYQYVRELNGGIIVGNRESEYFIPEKVDILKWYNPKAKPGYYHIDFQWRKVTDVVEEVNTI